MNRNESPRSARCRVLLVDDSTHMVDLIQAHLQDPRIDLTVSTTGQEGIERFQHESFDVVLMDIHMPEMDGYEATRAIRFWERLNNLRPTPIAALTADNSTSALSEAYGSGFTHYLSKPIKRTVLLQTVRQYFSAMPTGAAC